MLEVVASLGTCTDPYPTNLGHRRRVPDPSPVLHLIKIRNALLHRQTPNSLSLSTHFLPSNSIKNLLPTLFPIPIRIAKLQGPIGPVGPAPPFVQAHHHVPYARALTHRLARPALRPAQWAWARQRCNRHSETARREPVLAVRHDAKREPFCDVRHALGGELGLERRLRVELVQPGRVELGNEREAREGHYGGVEVPDAEAVVESAVGGTRWN